MMVRSQYVLVSAPGVWHRAPATLVISYVIKAPGVSFVLMSRLWGGFWMGAGPQKDQAIFGAWNFQPTEGGEGLEIELIIDHAYVSPNSVGSGEPAHWQTHPPRGGHTPAPWGQKLLH